jgi:hypothetical protein
MDRGRHPVDEAKAVHSHQRFGLVIGQALAPSRGPESKQPVRRRAALCGNGVGEAAEIGGRAPQRRRSDETPEPLPTSDESFVDENFNRARHRKSADAKALGELGLAVDAIARLLAGDILPQPIHEL